MIKQYGGVFGRNPTFNNLTVDGTLTAASGISVTSGNISVASGSGIGFSSTSDPSVPAVAATGAIIRTATNVSNNDTVTVGSQTYTFKTTLTPANYEVLIGADAAASLTNLRHAINNSGGTPGTDYQVPAANTSASASAISGSNLPLVALVAGTSGNSISLSETAAQLSVTGSTLQGGANAGGMTSELLSDYEQGSWTPSYSSSGGTLLATYGTRLGSYTKIGNVVTCTLHLSTSFVDASAASGDILISGLPYASSASLQRGVMSISVVSAFASSVTHPAFGLVGSNATTATPYKRLSSDARSGTTTAVVADLATGGPSSNNLIATLVYMAA
jgi:hypothetical protein